MERSLHVDGRLITANENMNALIYDAEDVAGNYEVLYCAIERELDHTQLFFKTYHDENPELLSVAKLYLRPQGENGVIFIEVFFEDNVVEKTLSEIEVPYDAKIASRRQAWFMRCYGPVVDYAKMDTPQLYANHTSVTRDYSKLYMVAGEVVRCTFKVTFWCELDDIIKNGGGTAEIYAQVSESNITTLNNSGSSINSSTQDVIYLESANVKFYVGPNLILKSQKGMRNNMTSCELFPDFKVDISFGFQIGPVSGTGTFDFTNTGKVNSIGYTPLSTIEDGKTKYAKSTESGEMKNGWMLGKKGAAYGIEVSYSDGVGAVASEAVGVRWNYKIATSTDTTETEWDYYTNTYYINIGKN